MCFASVLGQNWIFKTLRLTGGCTKPLALCRDAGLVPLRPALSVPL